MPFLFLLFIAVPIMEIFLLIQVGRAIGSIYTILIVIGTAILGTAMLKRQGMATLAKAQNRMQSGEMPAQQLLEGLLLVIGGVLLLTPGFFTDLLGFLCLIPRTREYLANQLARRSVGNLGVFVGTNHGVNRGSTTGHPPGSSGKAGQNSDIIDGDYREID